MAGILILPDVGARRAAPAQGGAERLARRRGRTRLAGSRCTWPRRASARSGSSTSTSSTQSNLQRQVHPRHVATSAGRSSKSARERITRLNPRREGGDARDAARRRTTRSTSSRHYDVIVDGTDNFPTRYLVERRVRAARQAERVRLRSSASRARPSVFATPRRARATAASIRSRRRPGSCRAAREGGVLGVLPGVIGTHSGDRGAQAHPAGSASAPRRPAAWCSTPRRCAVAPRRARRTPAVPCWEPRDPLADRLR